MQPNSLLFSLLLFLSSVLPSLLLFFFFFSFLFSPLQTSHTLYQMLYRTSTSHLERYLLLSDPIMLCYWAIRSCYVCSWAIRSCFATELSDGAILLSHPIVLCLQLSYPIIHLLSPPYPTYTVFGTSGPESLWMDPHRDVPCSGMRSDQRHNLTELRVICHGWIRHPSPLDDTV